MAVSTATNSQVNTTANDDISLCKLADALMVPLHVINGDVSGQTNVKMRTKIDGLRLPFKFKAKKMFSYGQTGVLFHIAGNLYIMVAHNPAENTSSAFVIDAAKCEDGGVGTKPEKLIARKSNLGEAVHNMGSAIVAAFYRKQSMHWAPLKLKH